MRWFAAWCLYWLGDLTHRVIELVHGNKDAGVQFWCACRLASAYQFFMGKSHHVQGRSGNGPWEKI